MPEPRTEPRFGTVNFERRRHPRFSINLPVEYWPANGPKGGATRTLDASEGGLLLYLPAELDSGQNLRVRLFIDSGLDFMSIEADVQVVWKDLNLGDRQDYRMGVKFVEISPQDHSTLRNFLKVLVDMKSQPNLSVPSRILPSDLLSRSDDSLQAPDPSSDKG